MLLKLEGWREGGGHNASDSCRSVLIACKTGAKLVVSCMLSTTEPPRIVTTTTRTNSSNLHKHQQ